MQTKVWREDSRGGTFSNEADKKDEEGLAVAREVSFGGLWGGSSHCSKVARFQEEERRGDESGENRRGNFEEETCRVC